MKENDWQKEHPNLVVKETQFKHVKLDYFLDALKKKNIPYYMTKSEQMAKVIANGKEHVFRLKKTFPNDKMWLFARVKAEAETWVEKNPNFIVPDWFKPSVPLNEDYCDADAEDDLIGLDVKHAFWRIAFTSGIISENTYKAGTREDCKAIRLACLSVLGRQKSYQPYVNGYKSGERVVIRPENKRLREVFHYIRHKCYGYMSNIAERLGDEFYSYRVDEIIFKNTDKNLEMVMKYLDSKNLIYEPMYIDDEESDEEE